MKLDNADVVDANSSMPNYFRSSMKRELDKRLSQVFNAKILNEFSNVPQELGVLRAHLDYR